MYSILLKPFTPPRFSTSLNISRIPLTIFLVPGGPQISIDLSCPEGTAASSTGSASLQYDRCAGASGSFALSRVDSPETHRAAAPRRAPHQKAISARLLRSGWNNQTGRD